MATSLNRSEILLILIPLTIMGCLRLAGFDGMVGQDGYAYVDYARAIRGWISGGAHPGPFIWPPGYPLAGALLSFAGISVPWSMQLVSTFSLIGTLVVIGRMLKMIYPTESVQGIFYYLLLFGLFAPYFLRIGMVTTSDMLACFMVSVCIYSGYSYTLFQRGTYLMVAAFAFSFGTLIRYPVAVVLAPVVLYLIYRWMHSFKIVNLAVLLIPLVVFIIYRLFNEDPSSLLSHQAIRSWQLSNFVARSFNTQEGFTQHFLPSGLFVLSPFFHPGFIWAGFIFLILSLRTKQITRGFWFFTILPYLTFACFLAGYPDQNPRHLLVAFPIVLLICYYGFGQLSRSPKVRNFTIPIFIVLLLMQSLLSARAFRASFLRNALEQKITARIKISKGEADVPILYGFDMDVAVASRGVPFEVRNLFREEYASFERGALVLFNEKGLTGQWKGKNPMINWEKLKNNYRLITIESYENGWQLYRIE